MAHVLGAWSLLLHAVPCLATSTPPCGGSQSPYSPQHLELHTLPDLPLPISTLHIENKDPPPGRQPSCLDKGREAYVPLLPSVPAGELGMNIGRVRVTCASLWGISVQGKMVAGSTIVQLGRLATILSPPLILVLRMFQHRAYTPLQVAHLPTNWRDRHPPILQPAPTFPFCPGAENYVVGSDL